MRKIFRKRKGSTLAFTIIIFAVLMVLGTFSLSFMLTENTQSLHHKNKAQAFYYARSGAEIVEKALIDRLISYGNDVAQQTDFVDRFDEPREIDVDLSYITNPVIVKNELINGKKIITITSTVIHQNITQTVKKGIYSTSSMTSTQGFMPGDGSLFVYLGDIVPQEKLNNGKSRSIPSQYVTKVPDDEKSSYKAHPFPSFPTGVPAGYIDNFEAIKFDATNNRYYFDPLVNTIDNSIQGLYIDGDLNLTNGIEFNGSFNLYVNGNLSIDGTVKFNGQTNIYAKETVYFGNNLDLLGSKSNAVNQLRIYTYNSSSETNSMSNFNYNTTANNGKFKVQADLYVDSGNINLGFPQNAQIDGHVIYNGDDNVNIKTNSNSYNDRLITGSIYAPFGTIHLGISTYQVATVLGGQAIGNNINVYPNNVNQGNKFYKNSTEGRIENNPIPIDISEGIDTNTIRYESFFIQ